MLGERDMTGEDGQSISRAVARDTAADGKQDTRKLQHLAARREIVGIHADITRRP